MTNAPDMNNKKWQIFSSRSLPIRNRLVRGSLIIVFLAIAIMGAFVYLRTTQTNSNLIDQLDSTTRTEAENILNTTAEQQTEALSSYFASLNASTLSIRDYNQNLLSNQSTFGTGSYWDAEASLSRNEQGSWDNPDKEIGSVFIPAALNLNQAMISDLNTIRHMDLVAPSLLEANSDIIAVYFGSSTSYTLYYPNINLAGIVPLDFNVTQRPWYLAATPDANPDKQGVWSAPYLDAALNGIVITNSAPVYDRSGRFRGVVAQDIQLTKITEIVTGIKIGDTGYAFLIDQDKRLIALPSIGYEDLGLDQNSILLGNQLTDEDLGSLGSNFRSIITNMATGRSGFSQVTINGIERFVVYRPVDGVNFSLAIIVPTGELLSRSIEARQQLERENLNALIISLFIVLGILILTSMATVNFGNNLTKPLISLTETAKKMAGGDLSSRADVDEQNEIGTLALTLNSMAEELNESINTLELRVSERTQEAQVRSIELETANKQIQRRASQFEALAQVVQSITSIRELPDLLPQIASVISEKYGFYHVGIFLIDDVNEYAILTAANSEGGKRMLERHHRLKVGEEGIVGRVTGTGAPRIALDVGEDATYFNNPDLPETHSEMALPLNIGEKIIGALDVQSKESGAFTDEDIQTLSLLASQVSLAIENAHLFESSNKTLSELQVVMRQSTRDAWKGISKQQELLGYRYNTMGATPLKEPVDLAGTDKSKKKANKPEAGRFVVPIELRGEVIGNLVVQSPTRGNWNEDEQDLIKAVAERVALSAENARLFEETTKRAERERLVSEITGKIRSHNDPQAMIDTAVNELKNVLGASRVEIIPQSTRKSGGNEKV